MAGKISTATAAQDTGVLDAYDAIVASPRGTYANSHGALAGIRYAREFAISDGIRGLRRIGLAWSEGRVVPTEEPTATIRTRPHKHSVSTARSGGGKVTCIALEGVRSGVERIYTLFQRFCNPRRLKQKTTQCGREYQPMRKS